tara:strand:- start:10106 stop:11188 length:1083 start_codon:yes stop_codon:yes gene_type:complete
MNEENNIPEEKNTENSSLENESSTRNENLEEVSEAGGIQLPKTSDEVLFVMNTVEAVKQELKKVLVGQEETIEMLLTALLSNGHVLLEGVPGVAKTLLAKLTAKTLDCEFSRIQFTPDLMPSDILGTSILNMKTAEFEFRKGPIFSNFILIDEINRAPAKTQAALFEVMEERQVTTDNHTYKMGYPLFVIATQNPIDQEGTYKLPEAQLDRFLFKLKLSYPSLEDEAKILERFKNDFGQKKVNDITAVLSVDNLKKCSEIVENLHISSELIAYIAKLVNSTRNNGDLYLGASPRASLAILKSAKALAAIRGRAFVTPEDIISVASPVLNHRILLSAEKELEGKTTEDVINDLTAKIEVPR